MSAVAAILTLKDVKPYEPTLEALLKAVADVTRIRTKELHGRRRWASYARARHIYYYAAHVLTSQKGDAIGGLLGRDRSTSSYGHMVVKTDRARFEPELSQVLSRFWHQEMAA